MLTASLLVELYCELDFTELVSPGTYVSPAFLNIDPICNGEGSITIDVTFTVSLVFAFTVSAGVVAEFELPLPWQDVSKLIATPETESKYNAVRLFIIGD